MISLFDQEFHVAQAVEYVKKQKKGTSDIIEPRSEKTGLRGFRPGPTQTGLYSHRRWLET